MRKYNLLAILLTFLAAYSIVEGAGIEDAKAYSKNSSIQWVWATEAINHYSWNGNEYVLDVGCGDGKITALIAKDKVPNGSVIGLDISQNMIQEASTNFQLHDYPNLSFVKEDIVASRLENKFDLVTSFCCLNWVLEQETALQNIHKSLVSGGKFLLVVAEKNSNDFLSLNEKLSKSEKWKLHLPEFKNPNIYFTKDEYISLLKDAGFSEIESKVIPMDSTFPNKEAFLSWLKPVLGFISKLPNHLQEEYVLEFANNIINATPVDPDGTIHIITNRLQLVAKKL